MPYRDRIAERDRVVAEIGATWRALQILRVSLAESHPELYAERAKPLQDRLQQLRSNLDWIDRGGSIPEYTSCPHHVVRRRVRRRVRTPSGEEDIEEEIEEHVPCMP